MNKIIDDNYINDVEDQTLEEDQIYQEFQEDEGLLDETPIDETNTINETEGDIEDINKIVETGLNVNRVVTERSDTNVKTYTEDEVNNLKADLEKKLKEEQTKVSLLEEQHLDNTIKEENSEETLKRLEAQGRILGMNLKQYLDYIQEGVLYNSSKDRSLPIDNVRRDYEKYISDNDKFSKIGNAYKNNIGQTFKQKYHLTDFQVKHYLKDAQVAFGVGLEEIQSDVIESYLKGKFGLSETQKERTRQQEVINRRVQTVAPKVPPIRRPVQKQPPKPRPINFAFEAAKSKYEEFLQEGYTADQAKLEIRKVPG